MNKNVWYILGLLGQLGFIIALPAALFAYLGAKLDKLYSTSPLFVLSGLGLAILVSSLLIYSKIKNLEK